MSTVKILRNLLFSNEAKQAHDLKVKAIEEIKSKRPSSEQLLKNMKETGLDAESTIRLTQDMRVLQKLRGNNLEIPAARKAKQNGDWKTIAKIVRRHVEGSFFSKEFKTGLPNYDDDLQYRSKKEYLTSEVVDMAPDEYIREAAKILGVSTQGLRASRSVNEKLLKSFIDEGQINIPLLDYSKIGKGQEGIHRALAAEELGIKRIPVLKVQGVVPEGGATKAKFEYQGDTLYLPHMALNKEVTKEEYLSEVLEGIFDPPALEVLLANKTKVDELVNELDKQVQRARMDERTDYPGLHGDDVGDTAFDFYPSKDEINRHFNKFDGDFNKLATQEPEDLFDDVPSLTKKTDQIIDDAQDNVNRMDQRAEQVTKLAIKKAQAKYSVDTKVDQVDELFKGGNVLDNLKAAFKQSNIDYNTYAALEDAAISAPEAFSKMIADLSQADLTIRDLDRVVRLAAGKNSETGFEYKYESGDFLQWLSRGK